MDIDWCTRTLTVAHSGRRTTKRRTRIVPMSAKLHEILRAGFESAPSGSVLVCDVGGFNIDRRVQQIIKDAKVPEYPKPFHTLRKCCETEWMDQHPVLTVADWMGHSPEVARAHYTRPTQEALERVTGQIATKSPQTQAAQG